MNKVYQKISEKIINDILQVKPGQSVILYAEIHNVTEPKDPLEEIPFLEDIAISLRKKKALPILDISTENLHKRFFEEVDDNHTIQNDIFSIWINGADYFIDFSWRSNPMFYKSIPEQFMKKYKDMSELYIKEITKKKKKIILLGTPTKGLAKYYNIDQDLLIETFYQSIDIDYLQLKKKCLIFSGKISQNKNWQIVTKNRILQIDLIGKPQSLYGEFQHNPIVTLPTGLWKQNLLSENCNGILFCDYIYHQEYTWSNVQLIFNEGKIIDIETEFPQENTKLLKTNLRTQIKSICLNYGLNENVRKMSLYPMFDILKFGNLSMTILLEKHEFLLLSQNADLFLREVKAPI